MVHALSYLSWLEKEMLIVPLLQYHRTLIICWLLWCFFSVPRRRNLHQLCPGQLFPSSKSFLLLCTSASPFHLWSDVFSVELLTPFKRSLSFNSFNWMAQLLIISGLLCKGHKNGKNCLLSLLKSSECHHWSTESCTMFVMLWFQSFWNQIQATSCFAGI